VLRWFAAVAAATHRDRLRAEPEGYSDDLRRKLEGGMAVTAADFVGYGKVIERWRQRCTEELPFDVFVCPTVPSELPGADEPETPEVRLRVTLLTRPFNALGWPSATTRDGTMFSGQSEEAVLGAALAWEEGLPPVELAGG
jgi:Asp-tRNA(Asn)/Glu-tRNA(Gln) amidotransferase A subunit family amidase